MLSVVRQVIQARSRNKAVSLAALVCEKFLRAYYNESATDFASNGERKVIKAVCKHANFSPIVALDVGANEGRWALSLLQHARGRANIHCFEIIPETATQLRHTVTKFPGIEVHKFGLSSSSGEVDVCWNKTANDCSSVVPRIGHKLFAQAETQIVRCRVEKGDDVVKRLDLPSIDILKIDVEGHEVEVLQGFRQTLASSSPLIQFEYGTTYLPARHTLQEIYKLLEPLGYVIGRLHADHVKFKPYEFSDDHFRMGNYIAVKAGSRLHAALK